MPKIYKITTYLVDGSDEFNDASLEDCLVYCTQNDLNLEHTKIQSADIGPWYDDHPLNYYNCPKEEFEKYFKEN